MRLLGGFIRYNAFLVLTWEDRPDLDYHEAMKRCANAWSHLFGFEHPYQGGFPHGYLSNTRLVPR